MGVARPRCTSRLSRSLRRQRCRQSRPAPRPHAEHRTATVATHRNNNWSRITSQRSKATFGTRRERGPRATPNTYAITTNRLSATNTRVGRIDHDGNSPRVAHDHTRSGRPQTNADDVPSSGAPGDGRGRPRGRERSWRPAWPPTRGTAPRRWIATRATAITRISADGTDRSSRLRRAGGSELQADVGQQHAGRRRQPDRLGGPGIGAATPLPRAPRSCTMRRLIRCGRIEPGRGLLVGHVVLERFGGGLRDLLRRGGRLLARASGSNVSV